MKKIKLKAVAICKDGGSIIYIDNENNHYYKDLAYPKNNNLNYGKLFKGKIQDRGTDKVSLANGYFILENRSASGFEEIEQHGSKS